MAWFRRNKDADDSPVQTTDEAKTVKTEGLFVKCPGCENAFFKRDFEVHLSVCPDCGYHMRIGALERLRQLFDDGSWEEIDGSLRSVDALGFVDTKSYTDRLVAMRARTGLSEAIVSAVGRMGGRRVVVAAMDLEFVGGSMGSVVGEKIARAIERSLADRCPLVIVSASGGARMQEGTLSLMQMAKISAALARLDEEKIPYVSILTDPTTGGVTASFAMLGDLNIAEPGAQIGFAGPRVIEQTIRQKLPKGFQRAEFLVEHGMLDDVVPREKLRDYVIRALGFFSRMHSFDDAVAYLLALGNEVTAMKLGLESVSLLLDRLERPQHEFRSVIVAGTNGKGSVSCMVESIARAAGLTTGLYTSPHLVSIEERIKVAGRQIPRERFTELASRVRDAAEALVDDGSLDAPPTYFEQVTAIAFLELAARRVDLAVLEVGMGGRLDATNVVDPVVAIVTPVALDHQRYLGESLGAIAAEKAAVIKRGGAAVIAHQAVEALEPLIARCLACDVLPVFAGEPEIHHSENGRFTFTYETDTARYERLTLGMRGRHQVENAMAAVHAAEALVAAGFSIPKSAIAEGLATAEWPGRLEMVLGSPPVLLDGAHNPAGAHALRSYLDEFCHSPLTLVFGAMDDKQVAEMAAELFPVARTVVMTRPSSPRAIDPASIVGELPDARGGARPVVTRTVDEALAWAFHSTPRDGLICVAGSLYLVGEVRSRLASRDPFAPAGRRP